MKCPGVWDIKPAVNNGEVTVGGGGGNIGYGEGICRDTLA